MSGRFLPYPTLPPRSQRSLFGEGLDRRPFPFPLPFSSSEFVAILRSVVDYPPGHALRSDDGPGEQALCSLGWLKPRKSRLTWWAWEYVQRLLIEDWADLHVPDPDEWHTLISVRDLTLLLADIVNHAGPHVTECINCTEDDEYYDDCPNSIAANYPFYEALGLIEHLEVDPDSGRLERAVVAERGLALLKHVGRFYPESLIEALWTPIEGGLDWHGLEGQIGRAVVSLVSVECWPALLSKFADTLAVPLARALRENRAAR